MKADVNDSIRVLVDRGRQWCFSILLWVAVLPAAYAMDLKEVYALAKENDTTFAAARAALQAAEQKVPQARSALLPSLTANGTEGDTKGTTLYTDTPEVQRSFNSYTWTIQLSQPLFRAQNFYAYGEARALVEQAQAQFVLAEQDLLVRVAQAYFDVVSAQETIRAAEAQVRALEEQLKAADHGFKSGVASITDVDDARSRAASAQAQRDGASADLDSKRAALEAIIGSAPSELTSLRADVSAPTSEPNDLSAWVLRAEQENPNVRAAQAGLEAATQDLSGARAQRLPAVDLVASYGGNYSSGNIIDPIDYATHVRDRQISVEVSVPLLDGGAMHSHVVESRAKLNQARSQHEAARRQAVADVRQTYAKLRSAVAQISALQTAVASGENSAKGNRVGYVLGIRINSDVLNAEQQLFASRRDLAQARYDALLQGLKLKAAVGALQESDINAISALLAESP
jgi:outer membrane protein